MTGAKGGWLPVGGSGSSRQRDNASGWKKVTAMLAALLAVAVALIIWQVVRAERLKRQIENARQSAFYSLVDGLQSVELNLSKFMVSATPGESALLLSRIAMQAGEAQSSLAQLPLDGETIPASIKFVNQVSDYARTLAAAAAAGKPYSDTDQEQLQALLAHCAVINNQLREMMSTVPNDYWAKTGSQDQSPLVRAMDTQNASEYPSLIYDGPFSDGRHTGEPKGLNAEQVDADEALRRAVSFIGVERVQATARTADTNGPVATYGFVVDTFDGRLNVHVTRQGGQVLWIIPDQGQYEQKLMIPDCVERALEFLTSHGFGEMESSYFQQYEGLAVINFAAVDNGVLMYPDLVKVQIRMDTGAVVGLESNNYLMNHTDRSLETPQLNVEQAREMVSDRLKISNERLCVIPINIGEKLAWEFIGTWADSEFLIYIDAMTGKELQILKIIDAENGQLTI